MTLLYVFKILEHQFGLKGIFITFRGKIGQVGSVRKKVYFLQQGTHALSNLSLKASFNTSVTKTDTGAIGVSVYLFY
jgi:ribosomal protein S3